MHSEPRKFNKIALKQRLKERRRQALCTGIATKHFINLQWHSSLVVNMTVNGHANGHLSDMERVFPESHLPLAQADPEIYSIIEDEKRRQW